MYLFGKTSKRRQEGVNKYLVLCSEIALSKSKYDMTIPWMGGVRTDKDQNDIFKNGNSKCDGYDIKSYHQSGNAIDVIPVIGKYKNLRASNYFANLMLYTWQELLIEGKVKGIMTWGGTFGAKGWDKWHFEIK